MILDLNKKNLKLCFYPYCDSFELPLYQGSKCDFAVRYTIYITSRDDGIGD